MRRGGEGWLEDGPDVFGDFFLAFWSGVDAVGLVEVFYAADAFEEVGDEGGLGFLGGLGEEGVEAGGEGGTHVCGHLHACDEDFDVGVFGAGFCDDGEEVFMGFLGGGAAEAVVSAEGDDEDVCAFSHGPCEAAQASGGGVSADAGVCDGEGEGGGFDFLLEEGGVGFCGVEAVACGDAVSEDDDAFFRIVCILGFLGD